MEIQNSNVNLEFLRAVKTNIPTTLNVGSDIVPTIEVNPMLTKPADIIINNSKTTTATSTLYTVPTGYTFYLNTIYLTTSVDATCDNTQTTVSFSMEGKSYTLIAFYKPTTTAQYKDEQITFPRPIRIIGGSTINAYTAFTAGNCTMVTNITGYLEKEYG